MGLVILMFAVAGILFAIGGFSDNGYWIETSLYMGIAAVVVWTVGLALGWI